MAKSGAVWGIDIGNCALKALRCRPHEKETNRIVVEAFEYIEYPKLLTQPEANREELVREALATFIEQNDLKGDRVAISVPGQNGLARFIPLPPVEAKKIPDIVKYEARQQIPFALEDVVWDYQALRGGNQDDGYALETEVGLFAMKRDQVNRALEPLTAAGIDVEFIQLAPLAIYNAMVFDRMNNLEDAEAFDPEAPPESTIVLAFGTDTTDLVITNGFRVWQRNIPIGGSHFTKALTKELQLTFSKAEHLKRNATKAEDPKALFSAMRPVFSDLVAEIQRSIGFFNSKNRNAKLGNIVALGNVMRLPGLQRYLSQNLEQKVIVPDDFAGLVGGSVTDDARFKDNHLTFADSYGLCVQALGLGQLSTNLLPKEITTARLIKAKKPWTVAAAALLMLGLMASYGTYYGAWATANVEEPDMKTAISNSGNVVSQASNYETRHSELTAKYEELAGFRRNLRSNVDGRLLWLELMKAVDAALPKSDVEIPLDELTATDVSNMEQLHIDRVECEYTPDVSQWYAGADRVYKESIGLVVDDTPPPATAAEAAEADGGATADGEAPVDPAGDDSLAPNEDVAADDGFIDESLAEDSSFAEEGETGPTGTGWIIEISGYHFHNSNPNDPNNNISRDNEAAQFVRKTFLKKLEEGSVMLPDSEGQIVPVTMDDLGIQYPILISRNLPRTVSYFPEAETVEEATAQINAWESAQTDATSGAGGGFGRPGFGAGRPGVTTAADEVPTEPPVEWKLRRYDFTIQFLWQPKPRGERENPESAAGAVDGDGFSMIKMINSTHDPLRVIAG